MSTTHPRDSEVISRALSGSNTAAHVVADRIARAIKAVGIAVWVFSKNKGDSPGSMTLAHIQKFSRPASLSAADWQKAVSNAVNRCTTSKSPIRATWKGADGSPDAYLFVPILVSAEVAGVAGFVGGSDMIEAFAAHHEILADSLALLAAQAPQPKNAPNPTPDTAGLAVALLASRDSTAAARISADGLRELLRVPRVCIFERVLGKWRMVASSGAKNIEKGSLESKALLTRFHACEAEKSGDNCIGGTLSRWFDDDAARHVGWLIERKAADASEEAVLRSVAPLIAHAVHAKRGLRRRIFEHPAGTPKARKAAWLSRLIGVGILAFVLVLLFWPVHQRFEGKCELLPSQRGTAVAEAVGRLDEILVSEGETVKKGQPLARIDATEITSRLEVARQDLRKHEADSRRFQQEGEMAQFRIAQLDRRRAAEEVAKLEEDQRRCTIASPVDGVVLTKDLALRRGEVVDSGALFCEIASLSDWDLQIKVSEADAGWMEAALRQRKTLPILYVLQARSDLQLEAKLDSNLQVSQMAYPEADGTYLFVTVRGIQLPQSLLDRMRPGFSGIAKIEGDEMPFIVAAFSRLAQFFRLRVLL